MQKEPKVTIIPPVDPKDIPGYKEEAFVRQSMYNITLNVNDVCYKVKKRHMPSLDDIDKY